MEVGSVKNLKSKRRVSIGQSPKFGWEVVLEFKLVQDYIDSSRL